MFNQFEKNMAGQGVTIPSSMSESDLGNKLSRPNSANKQKGTSMRVHFRGDNSVKFILAPF